jgi:t-SNARE complex subunit (syntaxin)
MLTKNDLNEISGLLDTKLESIKKDINTLKKDVKQIRNDQGTMLDLLDKEQMQQRKRIVRLEEEVGLPISQ